MFKYKKKKLEEIIDDRRIRKVDLRKHFGHPNNAYIDRWIKTEELSASNLSEICNAAKISILEFFEFEEKDIKPYGIIPTIDTTVKKPLAENNSIELIIEKEREINNIKLNNQREIFALKEKMLNLKESHIKELTQNTLRLKEEERENLNRQRIEDFERFEEKLKEKEKELTLLKESMMDMQMQYKELELSISQTPQRYKPQNLLNEPDSPFQKK